MDDQDPVDRIETELGLLLRRARTSSARIARTVHPDLEPSVYPLLALIGRTPHSRASDLADRIGISRGTMSRQLARIEELGLIERSPDLSDSRVQLLRLTDAGLARLRTARAARRDYLRAALDSWGPTDRALLADQLARLNHDLAGRFESR